jgi:chromosome partitioning protein
LLSINALSAANWVMVPVQAEYYSLEGFSMLMNSVKMIQRRINRNLKIFGVVMTMVDARSKLSRHVCDQVALSIPNKLFSTSIRRLVNVAEAPWSGAPTVLLNKPTSSGAGAGSLEYWTLAREFHRRVQDMRREFGVRDPSRVSLEAQGRR